jgi:hypothetical protein
MQKTAIVVIHGMGNQRPMETVRKLVDNLFYSKDGEQNKKEDKFNIYSAPERVTGSFDHRKLIAINDQYKVDCYEFYYAHLMKETSFTQTLVWMAKLLFRALRSERLALLAFIVILILLGLIIAGYMLISWLFTFTIDTLSGHSFIRYPLIIIFPLLLVLIFRKILGLLSRSFGDVIRYTVPHPENIEIRQKITNKAVEFLTNLHNNFDYDKIIVIGHSLGSIVAYEMLYNTFSNFNKEFDDKGIKNQSEVNSINSATKDERFKKMVSLGWKWRVTDFITCGSPLTHADIILTDNKDDFYQKVKLGEFATCPPKSKEDKPFYEKNGKFIPTHNSVFRYVNWNNIYFQNDYIGGSLKNLFGEGIHDKKLTPKNIFNKIPLRSHSKYWDKNKETDAFQYLKKLIY